MQHLAGIAAPVKMAAGAVLFPESAPPAVWLLLTGEVALESSTGHPAATARGGGIIGSVSTIAGRSLGRSAKVVKEGIGPSRSTARISSTSSPSALTCCVNVPGMLGASAR